METVIQHFLANENLPFTIALVFMLGLAFIEIMTSMIGFQLSDLLENFIPDMDIDLDIDVDADVSPGDFGDLDVDVDVDTPLFTRFLSWLRIGKVPVLILFVVFLIIFSIMGLSMQLILKNMFDFYLPAIIAVIPVFIVSIFVLHFISGMLTVIAIKEVSLGVDIDSLIGRMGKITVGTARKGSPAEAKVIDKYSKKHYVMVEPEDDSIFKQGDKVFLLSVVEGRKKFNVVKPPDDLT